MRTQGNVENICCDLAYNTWIFVITFLSVCMYEYESTFVNTFPIERYQKLELRTAYSNALKLWTGNLEKVLNIFIVSITQFTLNWQVEIYSINQIPFYSEINSFGPMVTTDDIHAWNIIMDIIDNYRVLPFRSYVFYKTTVIASNYGFRSVNIVGNDTYFYNSLYTIAYAF